jgi:hypothetical protein
MDSLQNLFIQKGERSSYKSDMYYYLYRWTIANKVDTINKEENASATD